MGSFGKISCPSLKVFFFIFSFQLKVDSDEYFSFFMLCIAYQRIDFIKTFELFELKDIELTTEHVGLLSAFSARDGATRDMLPDNLEGKMIELTDESKKKLDFFLDITRPHDRNTPAFKWDEVRKFVMRFCHRIKKSDNEFLPQVNTL